MEAPRNNSIANRRDFIAKGLKVSFNGNGFEKIVSKVTGIEKSLGIYELSQFTPAGTWYTI
jgi:hypothetical protein